MTWYYHQAPDGDTPTQTELTRYRTDSDHAEEQRRAFRLSKIRANKRGYLSSLLSNLTLPNSTVSLLALAGTALFASHTIYA